MGGAIYAYNAANINIAANSAVYNNTAAGYGGGIYASESNINIAANSAVYNNTAATVNCTPFVRQYGILSNKWGVLLCQREYRTNDTQRNSRSW